MKVKNKKLALIIDVPDDCVSKTECYYLCDSFINFGGIKEEKVNFEELTADLNTVETEDTDENEINS